MTDSYAGMNRPVHLARRDAFFERAIDLLGHPLGSIVPEARGRHVSNIIAVIREARKHAAFASRAPDATPREHDFLRYLELKLNNVRSAEAMIQHQRELEKEKGFLAQFLNATPEQCALPALAFQRRAEDIMEGLWHLLHLGQASYRTLREENCAALSNTDYARYKKAYDSFCREAGDSHPTLVMIEDQAV